MSKLDPMRPPKAPGSSIALAAFVLLMPPAAPQSDRDAGCTEWRDCRQMAQAAADRGEYERFHDLAWRAVQLGPQRDPALLTLLARAQALSGRPHDSLVMLDRLAGMGVAVDAETDDAFIRTRRLAGWPEVSAHIDQARRAHAPAAVATPPAGSSPPAAVTPAMVPAPAAVAAVPLEAIRFSTRTFTPGGFAYDAVSDRFLVGDRLGRKLFVVASRSDHATDFVRADSAGFHEIASFEIDAKRGDLWVVSTAPADGAGTLHKLQLVSGRPLRSVPIAAGFEPVALVDVAVTAAGAVLVLDSAGGQLFVLRPGASAVERVMRLDAREPASLAAGGDEATAYVAHRDGILRIDLRTRTATPLTAPESIALDRLERIRWRPQALIAIRVEEDGSRRILRFDLNGAGRAVTRAATLERPSRATRPAFLTFSGDELVYLADGAAPVDSSAPDPSRVAEFVAYRLRLR